MKTVVVTGSARGFGYAFLELFKERNFNVVVCDINEKSLEEAKEKLNQIKGEGQVLSYRCDITNLEEVNAMIQNILTVVPTIDIWINNAGVNQTSTPIWETDEKVIDRLIDIDLKGTILCSKAIVPIMKKQGFGQIYNVEGHGSNDATITGLSIYGTSKRAVTYFTETLAHECKELCPGVLVGKITPGIMITNFIHTSLGDGETISLDEKTKKVYNILGDYPETIAKYMVDKIIQNKKNNVKFTWLTNRKAAWRFLTSSFHRRDFFKEK